MNKAEVLTGTKSTMLSWMKVIESFEQVPEYYQNTCRDLLGDETIFPYMVLSPGMRSSRYKAVENLLFLYGDIFYILEERDGDIFVRDYPLQEISYLEVGNVLLYSWFSVHGKMSTEKEVLSEIFYNGATHRLLEPFLQEIRQLPSVINKNKLAFEADKFDYLATHSFKFMNYARLRGDEDVIFSLWQSEIRRGITPFLQSVFYQTVSLAHFIILTDKEIIIIAEDERSKKNKGKRYGGGRWYIPLRKIVLVSYQELDDSLWSLSFYISPEVRLSHVFEKRKRFEIIRFKDEFEKIAG